MILISHPRAGTEWFLDGLVSARYAGWELFSNLHVIADKPPSFVKGLASIAFEARLALLKAAKPTTAHKIFSSHLTQAAEGLPFSMRVVPAHGAPKLIHELRQRDDLFLLRRRNVRAAVLSLLIAFHNDHNYHGKVELLTKTVKIEYAQLFYWVRQLTVELDWCEQVFDFREKYVFEDLLSGKQIPTQLEWVAKRSRIKERGSQLHLVENLAEVVGWLDDLKVPGELKLP